MQKAYNQIRQTPPFDSLSDDEFGAFKRCSNLCKVLDGEVICRAGESAEGAFVLVEGKVVEQWADGIVTHRRPGQVLEPTALLGEVRHEHTLIARSDVVLIALSRKSFVKLFDRKEPIAYSLLNEIVQMLVHEIRDLNQALNELVQAGPSEPRG